MTYIYFFILNIGFISLLKGINSKMSSGGALQKILFQYAYN